MAALLLGGAILWGSFLVSLLRFRSFTSAKDVPGRLWHRYQRLLSRRGMAIAHHEGPDAIRRRAQEMWPAASEAIDHFTRDYAQLRFGPVQKDAATADLRRMNQHLRVIARTSAMRR
jgi:hypothetical protein